MAKILLADDSAFMRKILSDILTKNGYTDIVEAENGKQAIEKFTSDKPSLVLLDIIMPEVDGIGVLKDIVPKGATAFVISAVGQEDMINQAKAAGAKDYIVKPFDENQVVEKVKAALGESAQPAQPAQPAAPAQPAPSQPAQPAQPAPAAPSPTTNA